MSPVPETPRDHPAGQSDTNSTLVTITTVVSTSTMSVCGPPSHHSVPPGPTVTTGVCLRRQVIPSARIEALMQQVFQRRSIDSLRLPGDPLQTGCMMTGCFALLTGQGIDPLGPKLLK